MDVQRFLILVAKCLASGLVIYIALDHVVHRLGEWWARWLTVSAALLIFIAIWYGL